MVPREAKQGTESSVAELTTAIFHVTEPTSSERAGSVLNHHCSLALHLDFGEHPWDRISGFDTFLSVIC